MIHRIHSESRRRLLGICGALLPLLLAAGCGSSSATVTGKVYYKDKPLPGGTVTFVGPGGKGGASSPISEDGSYSIANAPVGEVTVVVETKSMKPDPRAQSQGQAHPYGPPKDAPPEASEQYNKTPKPANPALYVAIPGDYGDPQTSPLKYTVVSGSQEHKIELK